MAVAGARAKRFLQPGGANAIFARRRGMVAPAPLKETRQAGQPDPRSGKASGDQYSSFFSNRKNVNAIRSALSNLRNVLVEGFIAAKALRATVGNIMGQLKGTNAGGGGGGGGFLGGIIGSIGKFGLIAAVVIGVVKIFGPKIKEIIGGAFGGFKGSIKNIFGVVKEKLERLDQKVAAVYEQFKNYINVTIVKTITSLNKAIKDVNNVILTVKPIAAIMSKIGAFGISQLGSALSGLPTLEPIPAPPKLPEYKDLLGDKGLNFLSGVTLGGIKTNVTSSLSSAGDFLGGLYTDMTGFVGDLLNNLFASFGFTEGINDVATFLGLGAPFGAVRELNNPLAGLGISGTGLAAALSGGLNSLGNILGSPAAAATTPPANVPDVSNDPEFIKELQKLAQETGTKPSQLMALYNAESGINPRSAISSGATGIFQLMYGGQFGDVRYGKTREEFKNLSRAEQVKIHRKYLEDSGFFRKGGSGIADVKMANIAPAYLGQGLDEPIYSSPSANYEGNKNVDLLFGNGDGVITLREYQNFVNETGGASGFTQYDQNISSLLQPVSPSKTVANKGTGGVTIINGGTQVAAAPPRPRYDIQGEPDTAGGSSTAIFFSPSDPDRLIGSSPYGAFV